MDENIKVSVIMSEYNTDKKMLKSSIKSILNQTFKDFELIIIDDCGKNDVKKIVKQFNDSRIKVYKNNSNSGLVYSLNKALSLAKGDYVVRMDTDDFAYPDRIEHQYNFITNNKEYSVVGMKCHYYDGENIYGISDKSGKVNKNDLLMGVPLVHPTVIMNKRDILEVGGYKNFNRCEDYAMWIELFLNGYNMYVMDEIGIRYTIRDIDYKKRTFSTRKDLFRLFRTKYQELKPPFYITIYIYMKNIIASILPAGFLQKYHKKRFVGDNREKN